MHPVALNDFRLERGLLELDRHCRNNKRLRQSLLNRGRLSPMLVGARLSNSIIARDLARKPAWNRAWRQLKFTAEGISPYESVRLREISSLQRHVAASLNGHTIESRTDFARYHNALYRRISLSPYAVFVFKAAGIAGGRPDYWYLTDDELVTLAAPYGSFTALKNGSDMLHRHIGGRELERAVIAANPTYANHFRIGYGGFRYRSEAELVIGNLLYLNGIPVRREALLGDLRCFGGRSPVADFQFMPRGQILEIAQNTHADRGSRRIAYARRHIAKTRLYRRAGLAHLTVDADDFYVRGVIDALQWAEHVRQSLLVTFKLDIGPVRNADQLLFEDCADKELFISGSELEVEHRMATLGITSIATLQNRYSWVLTCLKHRKDVDAVLGRLKQESLARGVRKRVATRARNRGPYASLDDVRALCLEKRIRTQTQWVAFVKTHKQELMTRHIPSNLYLVYRKLGVWKSWADVLCNAQRAQLPQ